MTGGNKYKQAFDAKLGLQGETELATIMKEFYVQSLGGEEHLGTVYTINLF